MGASGSVGEPSFGGKLCTDRWREWRNNLGIILAGFFLAFGDLNVICDTHYTSQIMNCLIVTRNFVTINF